MPRNFILLPIYGTIITANCRIKVSNLQQLYACVAAVHTDSVVSTAPLPFSVQGNLGEFIQEEQGEGLILGAGIYEIGSKIKFRGIHGNHSLVDAVKSAKRSLSIDYVHAYTWKEIAFRGWPPDMINRFDTHAKKIDINFDQKRLWIDDWRLWKNVMSKTVESYPLVYSTVFL